MARHLNLLLLALCVHSVQASMAAPQLSRRAVAVTAAAAAGRAPARAFAADKGKEYNDCMSKCMYEATKITKGIAKVEVTPREEAKEMCKPQCRPLAKKSK
uniref:Uncharacterized protein n=1 Tax=Emiliania huxleyi TaxID=2903 RepID=A0A7S3TFD7_EMIHU|mmetsp:Transcript_28742/g.85535  ORF Transcript_28742/g.85535 Transcript_28742/m.85535 type:complete len:101 (-) Transcript_28742:146-448(-)